MVELVVPDLVAQRACAPELADGRGCAELLAHDHQVTAMLLERLGPNLDDLDLTVTEILVAVTSTLCSFWRPVEAFDPARSVLVHGDAHGWNTLAAGPDTYKFVDVEGLCSEPEHDLAVAMREYNEPLLDGHTPRLVRERATFLADQCGVDAEIVWEWGFIERVSTGLANCRDFDNDNGARFLEVARRCLE
jgi:streptomycin 6-kinase